MKKIKYLSLLAVAALLSLSSCDDFLDVTPDSRVYLNTVEQLRQVLVTAYMSSNYAVPCELSSDNVVDNASPDEKFARYNVSGYSQADDQLFAFEDVNKSTDNDSPSGTWSSCYAAIASANAVLEKAEEFEKAGKTGDGELVGDELAKLQAVKGEAYLIRAYHYFILCNVFCLPYRGPELSKSIPGVPYVTKPETTVKPSYERGTLATDYEMIEADLQKGLELVTDLYYVSPKYHFNKAAANAFAARFYLFKRDYPKVVEYATAAFKGNDPKTMLNDVWAKKDFYNGFDIFKYATSTERAGNMMLVSTYSSWWRRFVASQRYTCNRDAMLATILGPSPSWEGNTVTFVNGLSGYMNPAFRQFLFGDLDHGLYLAPYCLEQFEYTDKLAGIGYTHFVRAEFTNEETLLCRAEAYFYLGEIEKGFQDIKAIDDNWKNNPNATSIVVDITRERVEKFCSNEDDGRGRGGHQHGIMKPIHIDEVCPSATYHATPEIMPYLQWAQHYRRLVTLHNGMRWFDIKRLGLTVTHKYSALGKTVTVGLASKDGTWYMDPRYAIQIPAEVISAGFEPSTRESIPLSMEMSAPKPNFDSWVKDAGKTVDQ